MTDTTLKQLEDRLWKSADELRANSSLTASQYSLPVLGLIFLRYADVRFTQAEAEIGAGSSGRTIGPKDYQARGVMYVPDIARFSHLRNLPEASDWGSRSTPPWTQSKPRTLTSKASSPAGESEPTTTTRSEPTELETAAMEMQELAREAERLTNALRTN